MRIKTQRLEKCESTTGDPIVLNNDPTAATSEGSIRKDGTHNGRDHCCAALEDGADAVDLTDHR